MSPVTPHLRAATVAILSELQPVSPNKLLKRLRTDFGASHREANEAMLRMIQEGSIRRTFGGKLKLQS